MLSIEQIQQMAKEAAKRMYGRSGRTFKGADKIRRELDAAGQSRQDHGTSFSYPRGTPVRPNFETEQNLKQASFIRLAALCGLTGAE